MKCKFCNNQSVDMVNKIESPHTLELYNLYYCKLCKNRFFDISKHKVDLKKMYDEKFVDFQPTKNFIPSHYWSRQVLRIKKHIKTSPISVLDIGCRTGDFLLHFPENMIREGVETSRSFITTAQERGLKVYEGFVENIEFSRTYDIVTCYALLEHIVDPLSVLRRICKLINPGGGLVILIPTYQCLKRFLIENCWGRRWHMYSPPEHLNLFSKEYLDKTLSKHGLCLTNRYWTSGGTFNPFAKIPVLSNVSSQLINIIDEYTFLHRMPIFDHLYSFYKKPDES